MNKVHVVTSGEYSDYGIRAIFSTREKAEAYIKVANTAVETTDYYMNLNCIGVEEWELDEAEEAKVGTIYCCDINSSGDIAREWTYQDLIGKGARGSVGTDWTTYTTARSPISAEHARKLAVEARQAYIREQATGNVSREPRG